MEGHESRLCRAVPTTGKGKKKAATVVLEPSLQAKEAASPPSLEALMADSILFEEPLLKDPEEVVITGLAFVYREVVTKKV